MKIVLISPKGPLYRHRGGIFKKNLRYAPLTLSTLAAYVPPELNAHIEIIDEGIEDVPLDLHADLIGMTVITGGWALSNQPHCVVSMVAGRRCTLPGNRLADTTRNFSSMESCSMV